MRFDEWKSLWSLDYYGLPFLASLKFLLFKWLAEWHGDDTGSRPSSSGSKSHLSTSVGCVVKEKHDQESYMSSVRTVALCVSIFEFYSYFFLLVHVFMLNDVVNQFNR